MKISKEIEQGFSIALEKRLKENKITDEKSIGHLKELVFEECDFECDIF